MKSNIKNIQGLYEMIELRCFVYTEIVVKVFFLFLAKIFLLEKSKNYISKWICPHKLPSFLMLKEFFIDL